MRESIRGTLSVQYTGSQVCASDDTNCKACVGNSSFYVEAQGIANTSMGPLFVEVLKCFNPVGGLQRFGTYAGTLTTTAPNGKRFPDLGLFRAKRQWGRLLHLRSFQWHVNHHGGTGKFANAHGSAAFTAASGPSFTATAFPGPPSPFSMAGMAFYSVEGTLSLQNADQ